MKTDLRRCDGSPQGSDSAAAAHLLSALFITYERPELLEECLKRVKQQIGALACEFVVADDGSTADTQALIRQMPFDQFVLPIENRGLGANNNNGLAACTGQYILMLQDDWHATDLFEGVLAKAASILDADPQVGIIRFAGGNPAYFPLERRNVGGVDYYVCDHKNRVYDPGRPVYADPPHLRRASVNDPAVLGPYREGCPMEDSEQDYSDRFDSQDGFRIAFMTPTIVDYFTNVGVESSHRTRKFRYRLENKVRQTAVRLGLSPGSRLWNTLRPVWFGLKTSLIRFKIIK